MRTIEHINRELKEAKRELIKWETRVKTIEVERQHKMADLIEQARV